VKIETENTSPSFASYKAGLTVCDVRVYTTAREPVFNGFYGVNFTDTRDFTKWPVRDDILSGLQFTAVGKKNPSKF